MKDVAALAGVSFKTVSRVVNAEPGVSPELVDRVLSAVARLDYRHNLGASNLRRGHRTASIGVLLQDVGNSFSADVLRAVGDRARARGVVVLAASLDEEDDRERELVASFLARRVDGLVLMPAASDQSYLGADVRAGLAVVAIDRPPGSLDIDSVVADNRAGSAAAVTHLLAHGHRSIAYVGDRLSIWTASQRHAGYIDALAAAGIPVDPTLVRADLRGPDDACAAVAALLELPAPPTAIFAARNTACVGAVRALQEAGVQHRVALVGFDDFPASDLLDPRTTVVRQDTARLGHVAADLLLSRLDGDDSPVRRLVLATQLVRRGSGELTVRS